MTYDFSGPWTHRSGHHSALHTRAGSSSADALSAHAAVSYVIGPEGRVPPSKIILGIPLYGRSFLHCNGPGQKYCGHAGEEGTFAYKELPLLGAREDCDVECGAAWCVGGEGGWVSYDTLATVETKARYVKGRGLGGLFYWEGSGDGKDSKSLILQGFLSLHA